MAAKRRIAIVGAGNLGSALALALYRSGYLVDAVVMRSDGASLRKARSLAKEVGGIAARPAQINANVVWLCVPDGEIAKVARVLARNRDWEGEVALHSSGALTSDELEALRRRGASVASVHPLMTFVRGSHPALVDVPFAVEGDAHAVQVARRIVNDLGGRAYSIRKQDKVAYHAWGTFASPLLTALLATTERVAVAAGMKARIARGRMMPIVSQTVVNYATLGAPASFSGPFARGDVKTIRQHLQALRRVPATYEVYVALAKAALQFLPTKNRKAMAQVLKD